MKRLYFPMPQIRTAHKTVDELLAARIERRHIRVVTAKELSLARSPRARMLWPHRGLVVGGITGILTGLLAVAFPSIGLTGTVTIAAFLGTGVGVWFATTIWLSPRVIRVSAQDDRVH